MRHCWAPGVPVCPHEPMCSVECDAPMPTTCMAEHEHEGDHDFRRDDQIAFELIRNDFVVVDRKKEP